MAAGWDALCALLGLFDLWYYSHLLFPSSYFAQLSCHSKCGVKVSNYYNKTIPSSFFCDLYFMDFVALS